MTWSTTALFQGMWDVYLSCKHDGGQGSEFTAIPAKILHVFSEVIFTFVIRHRVSLSVCCALLWWSPSNLWAQCAVSVWFKKLPQKRQNVSLFCCLGSPETWVHSHYQNFSCVFPASLFLGLQLSFSLPPFSCNVSPQMDQWADQTLSGIRG